MGNHRSWLRAGCAGLKLYWQDANSKDYDIRISDDGTRWTTLKTYQADEVPMKNYSEGTSSA